MAVNLHLKYPKALANAFTKPSYITGKANEEYDFIGVKTIRISSVTTQAPGNYTRSGTSRYGTPTEVDDTYQELSITQDKSFSMTVDKGNNIEQDLMKNSGKVLAQELREQVVPMIDKYAFSQWIKYAGTVAGIATPSKTTIVDLLLTGLETLDDNLVPDEGRTLWVTSTMHKYIRSSTEFMALDALGTKALSKGQIGEFSGVPVIKLPLSYFPTGCYFLITFKESIMAPKKLSETKVHEDPPGISGALLEGRFNYDAFVLGQKQMGVYAGVLSTSVQATPTITDATGHAFTIASSGADEIYYTTDGSDPRHSSTRALYASQVTLAAGATVKAVAYDATNFTSAVASQAVA